MSEHTQSVGVIYWYYYYCVVYEVVPIHSALMVNIITIKKTVLSPLDFRHFGLENISKVMFQVPVLGILITFVIRYS